MTSITSAKAPEILRLQIEDLSRGGSGVARHTTSEGNRVIFVPMTLPGDEVEVRVTHTEKRFAEAEVLQILRPSPERVAPPCPVFGRCGGCQWQHVPYRLQWKAKSEGLLYALNRTEVARDGIALAEFPAENPWNYRNRIQMRGHGDRMGFFARGSRELVPVDGCAIARREINDAWPETRAEALRQSGDYKVEVEVTESGEIRRAWNARHAAMGFRQVNDEQNAKLRAYVSAQIPDGVYLLDLFGGAGNLSYADAARLKWVDCVDLGSPQGGFEGQPANYRFFRSDAAKWISRRAKDVESGFFKGTGPFMAVLDPPREGLGHQFEKISSALEVIGVEKIVAVGCDPDSWARDVSRFQRKGWKVTGLAAFDLFPQTPHIEGVAVLERSV